MIATAVLFLVLAGSLTDSIASAMRQCRRAREAWPPRRVIETRATVEDTF